jgi:hypothetical protein
MKFPVTIIISYLLLSACNDEKNNITSHVAPDKQASYFPVTSYLKGQITEIRRRGINPLKYTTIDGSMDSVWLKIENLETELKEFLTPVIDSNNLVDYFEETKFNDQTINAFTFTYNPVKKLPDTLYLTHWDIYVEPDKNMIKKIYMVKKNPDYKTLQLTWYSDKYCQIITIQDNRDGISKIIKEEKIKWDF